MSEIREKGELKWPVGVEGKVALHNDRVCLWSTYHSHSYNALLQLSCKLDCHPADVP